MIKKRKTISTQAPSSVDKKIDKLTELVQEEFHTSYDRMTSVERRLTMVEGRLTDIEERLGKKIDEGVSRIERRLDMTIQPQLDEQAHRIKVLERKVA
ncbi:hypothetical protein A2118_00610 [Candidatus Kaiserbacteria bacterium GWA2_50_9]|uniref:Uncharacterized protein n=1 Tax=Candidatus Kaiserbacteria bacterium GWA2_50_9 TaxID=1798474 RepID=A0A1F6BWA6_9BACT|nr:MAG: hypothetical protein A2118_00610 [Candidatus Kaiserbacteria bacterium GWA2_50_9]